MYFALKGSKLHSVSMPRMQNSVSVGSELGDVTKRQRPPVFTKWNGSRGKSYNRALGARQKCYGKYHCKIPIIAQTGGVWALDGRSSNVVQIGDYLGKIIPYTDWLLTCFFKFITVGEHNDYWPTCMTIFYAISVPLNAQHQFDIRGTYLLRKVSAAYNCGM